MKTLQDIVKSLDVDDPIWNSSFDLKKFSSEKNLFEFQKEALKNARKMLWLYYKDNNREYKEEADRKRQIFALYARNNIELNPQTHNHLFDNYDEYLAENNKISFEYFINRMSFWMATGSGKTLVIIKLIEMLGALVSKKELPQGDILFLAHRDNLIEQFKLLVDEFNQFSDMRINLINLKDYDNIKRQYISLIRNQEINVFYYRSDLFSDEAKESIIDYKNYDNNGNWYVLLDEAHKGNREDSKRQQIYSILSRNGFLFNFSATFTDKNDESTCVHNFNLGKFINAGYGKQIYVSGSNIEGFEKINDYSESQKQEIVLKTLILQTHIANNFVKIKKIDASLYHKPLLLTLVHSVNPRMDVERPSDLKMFFAELAKIANNEILTNLFEDARESLIQEMTDSKYYFGNESININISDLRKIKYKDVLQKIFNTETPGKLECSKITGNSQELVFRVKTSTKNFALIRINDIGNWIKDLINDGIEISPTYNNDSEFGNLNSKESSINILMGSRTFYEGWDSNRPNIVLFINIGKAAESKKFVLQSIGRGVRIEPQENVRTRLEKITDFDDDLYDRIKENFNMLESLFVFGTSADNLKQIIASVRKESAFINIGEHFVKNSDAKDKKLLIPIYTKSESYLASDSRGKYNISKIDFDYSKKLLESMGEKISIVKLDRTPEDYKRVKSAMDNANKYFDTSETKNTNSPLIPLNRIFDYFNLKTREFAKDFETVEGKIVHFEYISYKEEEEYSDCLDLIEKIEFMAEFPENKESVEEAYGKVPPEEYDKLSELLKGSKEHRDVSIKYIANHYYHPLLVSKEEKLDYLTHIISVDSEIEFIKELEEKIENLSNKYDWWMFSKLDETLDSVNMPYYSAIKNKFADFNPDFIFWMKKGDEYSIVFVDPKSATYTSYEEKADWYSKYFGKATAEKPFDSHGMIIKVYLRFFTDDRNLISDGYNDYWIDDVEDIFNL